jgi:SAM-dependent methyltransferase
VKYGALAPIYDRLMSHVGYHRWHLFIEEVVQRFSRTQRPLIFELGAGTGVLGERLAAAGFSYIGSDLSFPMSRQAKNRANRVACADCRRLPLKPSASFDLVLFLYDGINYLMHKDDYQRTFSEVHMHLKPGGLFLFDITTVFNSVRNFSDYIDADDVGAHFYFRHSYYNPVKSMQYNDFTIFSRTGDNETDAETPSLALLYEAGAPAVAVQFGNGMNAVYRKDTEHHEQKVFPVSVIRGFVQRRLFDVVGVWDNFTFKKHTSRSERVHFLLRKRDER